MKTTLALLLAIGLAGCDFVDADGNTSFRQVAQGLQSLGAQVAEMGEALERDADVEAVPWEELREVLPREVGGVERLDVEGDAATDRNGAGMSIAHARYVVRGDSVFVGVADLGALRSGVSLALRWAAPLFTDEHVDGEIEEMEVDGYPAIRIRGDDDRGVFVALIAEGRFVAAAGSEGRGNEDLVMEALGDVDYDRLEDWGEYGTR
jgi:hypothetical protein